jgi:hypothetical protein
MSLSNREILYLKTCALVVGLLAVALVFLKPLREKWVEARTSTKKPA